MCMCQRMSVQKSLLVAVQATEVTTRYQRLNYLLTNCRSWEPNVTAGLQSSYHGEFLLVYPKTNGSTYLCFTWSWLSVEADTFLSFLQKQDILQLCGEMDSASVLLIIPLHPLSSRSVVMSASLLQVFWFSFPCTCWLVEEETRTLYCVTRRGSLRLLATSQEAVDPVQLAGIYT